MFKELINTFFPIPSFMASVSFGVDISDESVKFVELQKSKNKFHIKKYGEKNIPAGVIESGKIKNSKKLEEILADLKKEVGIRSARVSLPDEQVYLFKLTLKKMGLNDIRKRIELSIEKYVPILAEDTIFDYEIIEEDENNLYLQVVVIVKNIFETYVSVFKNSGITIQSLEIEASAMSRTVIKKEEKDTYMIVDFGKDRTGVFVVENQRIMYTATIDIGSKMLTNLVQENFEISFEEAEKMKQEIGLQRNSENQELFSVLLNGVSILKDEISRHYIYWHTHKEVHEKECSKISKIILCGGGSNLIGLAEYIRVSMKLPVLVADVWINILDFKKNIPEISFKKSLSYTTALGLALGNFNYD